MRNKHIRWTLVLYDTILYALITFLFINRYTNWIKLPVTQSFLHCAVCGLAIIAVRFALGIYRVIWRYAGARVYVRLISADVLGFLAYFLADQFTPVHIPGILMFAIATATLLCALVIRMLYRYAFTCATVDTPWGRFLSKAVSVVSLGSVSTSDHQETKRIKVAIVGAGSTGITLAEEMRLNMKSPYTAVCFIDAAKNKVGRIVNNLPVLDDDDRVGAELKKREIQEIIFAMPKADRHRLSDLYNKYSALGYKIKNYDYPAMASAETGRRVTREFDIEDLLFRKQVAMDNPAANAYYKDKVILITGGGSIGSELCRQLAKMQPKRIVIVDIYENGAYDVQQELRIRYGGAVDVRIHIVSYTNRKGLERVFRACRPDIVINAAAHKHVLFPPIRIRMKTARQGNLGRRRRECKPLQMGEFPSATGG